LQETGSDASTTVGERSRTPAQVKGIQSLEAGFGDGISFVLNPHPQIHGYRGIDCYITIKIANLSHHNRHWPFQYKKTCAPMIKTVCLDGYVLDKSIILITHQ
jgi:hypothetical protein